MLDEEVNIFLADFVSGWVFSHLQSAPDELSGEIIPIGWIEKVPNLCDSGLDGQSFFSLMPSQVDSAAQYAGCGGSQCGGLIEVGFDFVPHRMNYNIIYRRIPASVGFLDIILAPRIKMGYYTNDVGFLKKCKPIRLLMASSH